MKKYVAAVLTLINLRQKYLRPQSQQHHLFVVRGGRHLLQRFQVLIAKSPAVESVCGCITFKISVTFLTRGGVNGNPLMCPQGLKADHD